MQITGHFIEASLGRVFVTEFCETAQENHDVAVLCLPSITEELNFSRAVLAKQCQLLAGHGVPSFIMDYYGSGDSEGEFEQANAQDWLNDVIEVGKWLVARGFKRIILLGVRVGALLLGANQERLHKALPVIAHILWKPLTSGKLFVSQFIRIKQANQMMAQSTEKSGEKVNWRNEILAGNDTEIAGYLVSKNFIEQLEALSFSPSMTWQAPTYWLELASADITPATKRFTEHAENVEVHTLATPAFWQVPEIFELPALAELGLAIVNKVVE